MFCKRLMYCCVLIMLSGCTTSSVQVGHEDARLLQKESSKHYAIYAMMSSNAYLNSDRTYFAIEEMGWIRVDLDGKPTKGNTYTPSWIGKIFSNLQFDIWELNDSNKTVISFKGTDEKVDWIVSNLWMGPSIPYKSAKKHVKEYMKKNSNRTVVVTGHSLGGGLALSISLWLGLDAYVFNPSPRVFDGWRNNTKKATRIAIYQEKEILSKLRSFWPKFKEVMNEKDVYQTGFNFDGVNSHRIDYLAEGLLRCAVNDQKLKEFGGKLLPVKVLCNL